MLKVWLQYPPLPAELFEVESLHDFLTNRFSAFPATGKIYHEQVSEANDVTPRNKRDEDRLDELTGTFYVVIYPTEPFSWGMFFAALAASAVSMAVSFLLRPKQPSASGRNRNNESPNGALSGRVNEPRVNGRIADMYGTNWSVFDMNHAPYTIFENNKEIEICSMVVGVGYYDILKTLDDQTPAAEISGTSIAFYNPYTSANSGDDPFYTIGDPINRPLIRTSRSKSVNGQTLRAPNDNKVTGNESIVFIYPDTIFCNDSEIDLSEKFEAGEELEVTLAYAGEFNLNGDYTILSVTSNTVVLSNPSLVNANWDLIEALEDERTVPTDAVLNVEAPRYTDWITIDFKDMDSIYVNVVAAAGMYKDDGNNQKTTSVEVELEVIPLDDDDNELGPAEVHTGTVSGSATDRDLKGETIEATLSVPGKCKVRMRRITDKDFVFNGVVVDEVQWRDLVAVAPETKTHFGNVTSVQTKSVATRSALSLKERKLKALVVRKLKKWLGGSRFSTELYPTNNAADILSAVCLDPYIGNRTPEEVDFELIYSTMAEVEAYFGTPLAAEFCTTFSSDSMSFEETVATICSAVFCGQGYRQFSKIRCFFEKKTDDAVLLFNHRNKVPGSEVRTTTFGPRNENDGIELHYTDPEDDSDAVIYIPEDRTALRPQVINMVGVRNYTQAYFHAWRAYGKLKHQHTVAKFTGLEEAKLLSLDQKILLADNTRQDVQDGDILRQDGLVLETSQPCVFEDGKNYVAILQLSDATVESIPCTAGDDEWHIVLSRAPRVPLVVESSASVRTVYMLVADDNQQIMGFLINEVTYDGPMTSNVVCGNYDDRFYEHDQDFNEGNIIETTVLFNGDEALLTGRKTTW